MLHHVLKTQLRMEVYLHGILNFSTERSFALRSLYPQYPLDGRLGWAWSRYGRCGGTDK